MRPRFHVLFKSIQDIFAANHDRLLQGNMVVAALCSVAASSRTDALVSGLDIVSCIAPNSSLFCHKTCRLVWESWYFHLSAWLWFNSPVRDPYLNPEDNLLKKFYRSFFTRKNRIKLLNQEVWRYFSNKTECCFTQAREDLLVSIIISEWCAQLCNWIIVTYIFFFFFPKKCFYLFFSWIMLVGKRSDSMYLGLFLFFIGLFLF